MKRICVLSALVIICLTAFPVYSEYYQYRDKDGNLHFTDDLYEIPEDQREETKTYESVTSDVSDFQATTENRSFSEQEAVPGTWDGDLRLKAQELDDMKEELDRTFERLQAEKMALGDPPPEGSKTGVVADYVQKVKELNQEIDNYHQQNKEFQKKVDEFNAQIKK